jgi:UDP-GlcNAc:undecaprenyl-phosphate GlcNAc-1-phosphate transferase
VASRLLVQFAAAIALWEAGFGWEVLGSESADFALTIVWVVGITNAFNLFDNSDGAAASVAAASAAGLAFLALSKNDLELAAYAIAIAGACLGFLRFNLARPSRIFLGDGGSMPLGMLIAGGIMAAPTGDLDSAALPAYALFVALPILDTTLVVISRGRRGAKILSGARDHLTHRLLAMLGSVRRVALALGIAQLTLCGLAIGVSELGGTAVAVATVSYFLAGAAVIGLLETPRWWPTARGRQRAPVSALSFGEEGPT